MPASLPAGRTTGAAIPPSPTGSRTTVGTNGQRARRVDLEDEVEVSDEWETSMSCDPSEAGQRTNSTTAKMEMELSTDVAGVTIASQSSSSEGELKLSLGGFEVASEQVERWQPPAGQEGVASGCEVTLKWSREVAVGDVAQTLSICWTWPILQSERKRQANAPWGQIDQIVVFADKEALDEVTLGKPFEPESVGEGAGTASQSQSQTSLDEGASETGRAEAVEASQSALPAPDGEARQSNTARTSWADAPPRALWAVWAAALLA